VLRFFSYLRVLGVSVVPFSHFQRQLPVLPPCKSRNWQAAGRSLVPAV
jgi:hypothetical protein